MYCGRNHFGPASVGSFMFCLTSLAENTSLAYGFARYNWVINRSWIQRDVSLLGKLRVDVYHLRERRCEERGKQQEQLPRVSLLADFG